jgi:hypothetical protein
MPSVLETARLHAYELIGIRFGGRTSRRERDGLGLEPKCVRTAAAAVGRRSALEYLRDLGDGIDIAGQEVSGDGNRVDQRMQRKGEQRLIA